MAIYSLNHKSIGKETQPRPYTAAAHVDYITRPKAMSRLEGERMPVSKSGAMGFMRSAEIGDRANGRVADKVMLALPRELSPEQRTELVRGFANEVTKGKAPWLAAFHDKGKDAHNPHCHLVIRDRDPQTGRRVFGMSDRGSTQRLRKAWTQHANRALERAGRAERIDDRTLEAQGKPGPATIHEGPKPRAMERGGRRPQSQPRLVRNAPGAHRPNRRVDYPALDHGRSRADHNADLMALREREGWDAIDADNRRRELDALRSIHHPPEEQPMKQKRRMGPGSSRANPIVSTPEPSGEPPNARWARPLVALKPPPPEKVGPFRKALNRLDAVGKPHLHWDGSKPSLLERVRQYIGNRRRAPSPEIGPEHTPPKPKNLKSLGNYSMMPDGHITTGNPALPEMVYGPGERPDLEKRFSRKYGKNLLDRNARRRKKLANRNKPREPGDGEPVRAMGNGGGANMPPAAPAPVQAQRSPIAPGTNPETPKPSPERPEAAPVHERSKSKAPKPDLISDSQVPGGPAPLKVAKPDLGLAASKLPALGKVAKPELGAAPTQPQPKVAKPDLGLAPPKPGKAQKPDLGPTKDKSKASQRGKGQEPDLER